MSRIKVAKDFHILDESNELLIKEDMIKVEPLSVEILKILVYCRNRVVTYESFVDKIWQGNSEVGKPALTRNIYKLRQLLSNFYIHDFIETIPKKGYRLNLVKEPQSNKIKFSKNGVLLTILISLVVIILILVFNPFYLHRIYHFIRHVL